MGSSGGSSVLDQATNAAVNYGSLGLAGYNSDTGKLDIKKGVVLHAADEGIGEITGRNLQRQALQESNARLEDAKTQAGVDLQNTRNQNFANDVAASNQAGAARGTAAAAGRAAAGLAYKNLGDNQDYLGL